MEKIKEFISDHFLDFVIVGFCALFFIWGVWLLYTASRTANDYHHVNDTVQSAERDNQQARQQIDSATAEIDSAQKQLNDSIRRAGEITNRVNSAQKRVDSNSKIVGECQDIIGAGRRDVEEAGGIFESVDNANQGNGAQADSNP